MGSEKPVVAFARIDGNGRLAMSGTQRERTN